MDRLNWILAGIAVVVGGFGAWYVRLRLNFLAARLAELKAAAQQTQEMLRHQDEMLRRQAEAAKKSVETLMKGERAWVVITTIYAGPLTSFKFGIANRGKTLARVLEIRGESIIVDRDCAVPEFPPYPAHGAEFSRATVLAPGESAENVSIDIAQTIDERKLRDIRSGKQRLYFYGFIRYFDFANEERRNQFGYQYVPESTEARERWSAAAVSLPQYNSHT